MSTFRDEDGVLQGDEAISEYEAMSEEKIKNAIFGPSKIQARPPTELVNAEKIILDQFLGGTDATTLAAFLPERIDWDKKSGLWMAESYPTGIPGFAAKLVGATTAWAIWTDKLGKPEAIAYGAKPNNERNWEMGWRLIFELDDELFVWDAFGLSVKAAQSAARRASKFGGWFEFDGFKVVPTNFGEFKTPRLTMMGEG
jgi:hypothetical protein